MAYNIGPKVINEHFLPKTQRDEINEAFKYLETCKQAPTSEAAKQLQQKYFNICESKINDLKIKIESHTSEIKKLEIEEKNMEKNFEEVKALNEKLIREHNFGETARLEENMEKNFGKTARSKPRSRSRSRSRSRDREKEEIEKKAMELFAIKRKMYDEGKKIDIQEIERHWNRLPPNVKTQYRENVKTQYIENVKTSKGGRTRKNKR